ncbi:uncharacterized protein RAG0_01179 [Rhynchosporium agropyri]|uniref:Indole-diterpene biosynthesis protein PaxU n=1 Tax=Rhynchosporium agropyri TaxID=914238 RepID=A0A1E1JVX3_9HELO|nr:uncharacterized protein RAG0_01179 [Rhynchosporium agropyri]
MSSRDVAKAPVAWEHFVRLGPSVFYLEPTTPEAKHSTYPDLILVAGWMDASPRNLTKYTAKYETLYPSARILAIITTSIDAAFLPNSASLKRIKAAMDILYTLPPSAKVLVHFFSVGGACTPGKVQYGATIRAFAVALPKNPILNALANIGIRIMFFLYIFAYWVSRKLDMIAQVRVDLNTKMYFDTDAPRMYIYSEADDKVHWEFVEEHMRDGKALGYTVQGDRWVDSMHCGHLLADSDRYWKSVTALWESVS